MPFLNDLKETDEDYRKFKIDDYLGRRELALENLHRCGSPKFESFLNYLDEHNLYEAGALITKGTNAYKVLILFSMTHRFRMSCNVMEIISWPKRNSKERQKVRISFKE